MKKTTREQLASKARSRKHQQKVVRLPPRPREPDDDAHVAEWRAERVKLRLRSKADTRAILDFAAMALSGLVYKLMTAPADEDRSVFDEAMRHMPEPFTRAQFQAKCEEIRRDREAVKRRSGLSIIKGGKL